MFEKRANLWPCLSNMNQFQEKLVRMSSNKHLKLHKLPTSPKIYASNSINLENLK